MTAAANFGFTSPPPQDGAFRARARGVPEPPDSGDRAAVPEAGPELALFSPREAEAWRRERPRTKCKTHVQPSQVARALAEQLAPMLGYMVRLTDRMQKHGWQADDRVYRAARNALHELMVRVRFQACGNPGGNGGRDP